MKVAGGVVAAETWSPLSDRLRVPWGVELGVDRQRLKGRPHQPAGAAEAWSAMNGSMTEAVGSLVRAATMT